MGLSCETGSDKVEIGDAFREVEEILETKYLRYCDPSQPLHLMTMLMARSAMNVVRFLTNHPRRMASVEQTPLSERQWVWGISIQSFSSSTTWCVNPSSSNLRGMLISPALDAFIHVLDTLQAIRL